MYFLSCAFDEVIYIGRTEITGYMDDDIYHSDKDSNFGKGFNTFTLPMLNSLMIKFGKKVCTSRS